MKKFFSWMLPAIAMLAFVGTSCNDDDEGARIEPPTIKVGEISLESETSSNVVVTVTPSENTETWYWKCEETGGETDSYVSVKGSEETQLSIPIELDKDYTLAVYAENAAGKSEEVTKQFKMPSASVSGDLVTFEIKNLSALSVDVEVKKSAECTRYAIGAVSKFANTGGGEDMNYDDDTFIESAQRSLNPNSDYPFQPYNTSDSDGIFTELTLNKAKLQSDPDNTGLIFTPGQVYVVGIYALNASGEGTLYRKEFTVPEVDVTKGQVNVEIAVEADDMTLTSVSASFKADVSCAKLITSIVHKSTLKASGFYDMGEDDQMKFLASNTAQCPQPYTGEFKRDFSTAFSPNTDFVISAVPIDAEGNIGKVAFFEGTTPGISFDGLGEIETANVTQTTCENIDIQLTANENVNEIRLLCLSDADFSKAVGSDLEWVMFDEKTYSHLWTVYKTSEISNIQIAVDEMRRGLPFYIYAVTVDANGNISPVQNIAELAGLEGETFVTMAEQQEEGIALDGSGKISLTLTEETVDGMTTVNFTVAKGEHTQQAWYFRDSSGATTAESLKKVVKRLFADYPELPTSVKSITFDTSYKEEYMVPRDGKYYGDVIAFITLDDDNKLSLATFHEAGTGNVTK